MTFQIDKNLPIPTNATRAKAPKSQFPFAQMEQGDSFFVPVPGSVMEQRGTKAALTRAANKAGVQIKLLADDEGIRVWRV